ncbi:MAG TPA: hypothetical protein VEC01_05470 [Noviherbaspirillum sp.]|nr:hypothetical protein [Noviherbaspirillum sp.]HYD94756.1 hypothetical protein [Noviherbaspirillum sp.]
MNAQIRHACLAPRSLPSRIVHLRDRSRFGFALYLMPAFPDADAGLFGFLSTIGEDVDGMLAALPFDDFLCQAVAHDNPVDDVGFLALHMLARNNKYRRINFWNENFPTPLQIAYDFLAHPSLKVEQDHLGEVGWEQRHEDRLLRPQQRPRRPLVMLGQKGNSWRFVKQVLSSGVSPLLCAQQKDPTDHLEGLVDGFALVRRPHTGLRHRGFFASRRLHVLHERLERVVVHLADRQSADERQHAAQVDDVSPQCRLVNRMFLDIVRCGLAKQHRARLAPVAPGLNPALLRDQVFFRFFKTCEAATSNSLTSKDLVDFVLVARPVNARDAGTLHF